VLEQDGEKLKAALKDFMDLNFDFTDVNTRSVHEIL
jgi:hypothetical protein